MANSQLFQLTGRTLAINDLVPTQDAAGAADLGKNTWEQVRDLLVGKEYAGVLSQSGTSAPTIAEAKNTLGSATITRSGVGVYNIQIPNAFTAGKTFIVTLNQSVPIADRTVFMSVLDTSNIGIYVRDISSGTFRDWGQVDAMAVYIKVFA